MKQIKDLEFYVLNENFNAKKIENFNIFRNSKFCEYVEDAVKEYQENNDYNAFKEQIKKELMYCFWSKAEYEVIIGDLFGKIEEKWDIYSQVLPNLDILCKLILENI